jgi:hypothetical protein
MSNLKHLSLQELRKSRHKCQQLIAWHQTRIEKSQQHVAGQGERLKWIEIYIQMKEEENG